MSKIHITLEIDLPFDALEKFLRLIREFDDSRSDCLFAPIYKRGDVPMGEIERIQRKIFPEAGPIKILATKDEVQFVKDALRRMIESEGSA